MTYEALARKYRPKTFEEVVGQDPIVRTLTNAIRERRIHHAYVFSGVRGVGKTTVARLFAKALNCEKGPTPVPCLVCDPCKEIAAGRDLDVIEMDAASRTGVDDVRDLIDTTRYAPARDRYKVFIIDEFHMLSKPAFNALLKTLEEPPPRVVFLMATTELHKVLPTVLSRTQQFDFRKVSLEQIASQLDHIADAEGVKATPACFEMLARAADGSVRDAESLLDQAIAFCGTTLREQDLRAILGLVPEETVEAFLTAAAGRDGAALLRTIADVLAEGHDLRLFHAGLIEGVRRLLVIRAAAEPEDLLGVSAEHQARLATIAERFTTEGLLRVFSVLAGLEAPLKFSDQPRYIFEAAAIRVAALADLSPIEDLIARFDADGPDAGPARPGPGPGARRADGPARGAPAAGRPSAATGKPAGVSSSKGPKGEADDSAGAAAGPIPAPSDQSAGAAAMHAAPPDGSRATDGSPAPSEARTRPKMTPAVSEALSGTRGPNLASDPGPSEPTGEPPVGLSAGSPGVPMESVTATSGIADEDGLSVSSDPPETVRRFLSFVEESNETLSVLIEHASAVTFEQGAVVLSFDETQAFARKRVEQADNLAVLAAGATRAVGRSMSVRVARIPKRTPSEAPPGAPLTAKAPAAPREPGPIRSGDGSRDVRPPSPAAARAPSPRPTVDESSPGLFPVAGAAGPDIAPTSLEESSVPFGPSPDATAIEDADDPPEPDAASMPDAIAAAAAESGETPIAAPDSGDSAPSRADTPSLTPAESAGARVQRLHSRALEDPAVKGILERFGGRIVDIKEIP